MMLRCYLQHPGHDRYNGNISFPDGAEDQAHFNAVNDT